MNRPLQPPTIFIMALLLFFTLPIIGTEQANQETADKNSQLKEELLTVYQSRGEAGLHQFVNDNKDKITGKFIANLAESAVKDRNETHLQIALHLATQIHNEKALAHVYYQTGEYFRLISDRNNAIDYYEKALQLFEKIKDADAQGYVYLRKGDILSNGNNQNETLAMYDKALFFFEKAEDLVGQGDVYIKKGERFFYTGDNLQAISMYEKALPLFEKMKSYLGQGNVYWRLGDVYFYTGDIEMALDMYDKALPFYEKEGDLRGQGNVYLSKGALYYYTGNNSKALEMYEKALPLFKKAKDSMGIGVLYCRKGEIYLLLGNNSKSLEMYDRALPLFEKVQNTSGQGIVYYVKGKIYIRTGDISKAKKMFDRALPFLEKTGDPILLGNLYLQKGEINSVICLHPTALKMYDRALHFYEKAQEPRGQGIVLQRKGDIYLKIGIYSKALTMYSKALPLFEKSGELRGQGSVYRGIGEIYFYIGNHLKALEMYQKAQSFLEKAGNILEQGGVYWDFGESYFMTGSYSKALEEYDKALTLFKRAQEPIGQGNVLWRKGDIYFRTGNNSLAIEMFDQALLFLERANEPLGQGNILNCKGDVCCEDGKYSRAIDLYDKAMDLFKRADSPSGQGNVYLRKGLVYFNTGHYPEALKMYDEALQLYAKIDHIESEAFTLIGKAKVLARLGKRKEALGLFEEAIGKLEKVRRQTAFSDLKRTFMAKVYGQYREVVGFMLGNGYDERGFRYAEAMRARVFLDQMAEGLTALEKGISPGLRQERDDMVSKLSALSKAMNETAGKGEEKKLEKLKEQYRQTENALSELLIKIRLENPLYAAVRYPEPITVKDLREKVLNKGESLIQYFVSDKDVYVFVVSTELFKVIKLEVEAGRLKNVIDKYLLSIREIDTRRTLRFGRQLYRAVFAPVEEWIKEEGDIIVVPDGQLSLVPFEALVMAADQKTRKPAYLVEKYRLKYVQSASTLALLRSQIQRTGTTQHFVGFGDPVYDYENFKLGKPERAVLSPDQTRGETIGDLHREKYDRQGGTLRRLQYSGKEVTAIARLFGEQKQKPVVYLREQAREERAKLPEMKGFDYIHFACHGVLGSEFQSLVLSQLSDSQEDGYFTLNEIMNCDYHARLVVLSACQTGTGKIEKGEGVVGLTRAMMYAGTPAVVASLWDVSDIATRELMVTFYQNMLNKGMAKEEALRSAKLEMLNNEKYSPPYYWSSFIMYGE